MKKFFNSLQKDTVLVWSFWVSIITLFLMVLVTIISYANLPPFIPLYNHMPWGYARLGKTYELFFPTAVVLGICIINTIVGIKLIEKSPLLARFLFLTMAGLALFTCIFVGRLIFITL